MRNNPDRYPVRVKRKWWQFWRPRYGMEYRPYTYEPDFNTMSARITMR